MAQLPDLSPRGPHDIYMFITCAEAYLQGQQYYAETHQAVCPAHPPCHLEHIVDFELGLSDAFHNIGDRRSLPPHASVEQGGPDSEFPETEEPPYSDEWSEELKHHVPHHHEEPRTEYDPEIDPGEEIVY